MKEQKGYTIMIVDDNDDVRRLLQKVLLAAGHNVIEAVDGNTAIELVGQTMPDLVLMDIKLPGKMDGIQVTARMKEDSRLKNIPVVALTASVLAADKQRAMTAGCSGFIGKPIDVSLLPGQVEGYVTGALPDE